MKKIIFLFLIVIFLASCTLNKNIKDTNNKQDMLNDIRYVPIGDSYTIGQGLLLKESFPVLKGGSM